jgi:hypothetical protein
MRLFINIFTSVSDRCTSVKPHAAHTHMHTHTCTHTLKTCRMYRLSLFPSHIIYIYIYILSGRDAAALRRGHGLHQLHPRQAHLPGIYIYIYILCVYARERVLRSPSTPACACVWRERGLRSTLTPSSTSSPAWQYCIDR